jgi:hypothetical protein
MVRVYGATQSDVIDRAGRALGAVGVYAAGVAADAVANSSVSYWRGVDASSDVIMQAPIVFNASTWDRLRNLQAGAPKFGLQIGDPRYVGAYSAAYFSAGDSYAGPAAANQFVVWRLRNPAASGKTFLVSFIGGSIVTAKRFFVSVPFSTASDRGTLIAVSRKDGGASGTVAVPSRDLNVAASLSVPALLAAHAPATTPVSYVEPFRIPAGFAIDVQLGDTTNATTDLTSLHFEWQEE